MISLSPRALYLCEYKVDFRKRFSGLLGEAYGLGFNPYKGDCLLFIKKDRTQLAALCGDALGLYLIYRRFEGGRLKGPFHLSETKNVKNLSLGEIAMLFSGLSFEVRHRVRAWQK